MALIDGLPDFVQLSPAREAFEIFDDGVHYRVNRLLDNRDFDLPSQAYDYIRGELNAEAIFLPGNFPRHPSEVGEDSTFYVEPGSHRLLLGDYSPQAQAEDLRLDYAEFLVKDVAWRTDPDDFYACYDWLARHPAFWSAHMYGNGFISWETNDGLGHDAPSVYKDDDGRVRVLLEAGPYTGKLRDQHSIDTRLVSIEATYEQAIISLAKKVDEFYDTTGTER